MQYIYCPECGPVVHKVVHSLCPDTALLDMLYHIMNAHPSANTIDMLDDVRLPYQSLATNGV